MKRLGWGPLTIRVRLGAALALALAPVLLLGAAQAVVALQRESAERQVILTAAAERSAAVARARMQGAQVILEALTPQTLGLNCAPRLHVLMQRLPGYANLISFDSLGRVICAAGSVGPDPGRSNSTWFSDLRSGKTLAAAAAPAGAYAGEPAVITAMRSTGPDGQFDGALAAVVLLSSLRPNLTDRSLPPGTQVALADPNGDFIVRTDEQSFDVLPKSVVKQAVAGSLFYRARDRTGAMRVYAAAPLIPDVGVVLSAPEEGFFSFARLNPLTAVLLPLAAFVTALFAVWVVAERVVVRWLLYLQRIAAIYARGRLSVRPLQAARGPPEIRALARTMDVMAEAIAARDLSLRELLAHKDALMREVHHRVKNNLQVISSLLNLQERALTDPAARAAVSDTRQRIGAMALIYRALYQGADIRRANLRPFLEELVGQLMTPDSDMHAPIRTELEADELTIDPDKLAPLALFAVEAISNVRKHASSGGVLRVRFRLKETEAILEIADEGAGGAPPVVGEGMGRTLMTAFARQLRGRLEIKPNDRGGITACLVFPAPEGAGVPDPEAAPPGATEPEAQSRNKRGQAA